ncbi:MAG: YfiR family protein [Burkholderiaceae bacterium]|nr:YfiR family protein [Burkholderiaceae bacterium]
MQARSGRWGRALCTWVLAIGALQPGVRAADTGGEQRSRVEAAFLRNFARYVGWPPSAFAGDQAPWSVCIVGEDPFGSVLEQTFEGRKEKGRSFSVVRKVAIEQLNGCQIVYLGGVNAARRRVMLEQLRHLPVLTVGHAPEFLAEGGIIRLAAGERIEMSINLDQARAASLTIPTKMLEVAHEVVDQGVTRRWR